MIARAAGLESPGEHEDEGLPYVRERTSRTNHMRAGSPIDEEAGAAIGYGPDMHAHCTRYACPLSHAARIFTTR